MRKNKMSAKSWIALGALGATIAPLAISTSPVEARVSTTRRTIRATVERNLSGNQFEIRSNNGSMLVIVGSRTEKPRTLRAGSVVQLTGYSRGGVFYASDVLDFGNGQTSDRRTIRAVVARNLSGDRFEIRSNNGDTLVIVENAVEPRTLRAGSDVELTGYYRGNVFYANKVIDLDAPVYNGNNQVGSNVTVNGRVTRVYSRYRVLVEHNGRTYDVRSRRDIGSVQVNDIVRFSGRLERNNVVNTEDVRITDDNTNDNDSNRIQGRVTRVYSRYRALIEATNGRTYDVRSSFQLPNDLRTGDVISVSGRVSGAVITASDVDIVDQYNDNNDENYNDTDGQQVRFRGVVTNVINNKRLVVRGSDNRNFDVRSRTKFDSLIRTGASVWIEGTLNKKGVVQVERVERS